MTNLIQARRMLMHGESAADFFPPETSVFLTSTIPDDDLLKYSFGDEVRTVAAFAPDYYLPFDFPVYGDMPEETRLEHIRQVGAGTVDMARIFHGDEAPDLLAEQFGLDRETVANARDAETEIVPLIKGTTPAERGVMERVADAIDASMIAKYGTQYMTVPGSGNYPQLRRVLDAISDETDGQSLLVVGLLSPTGKYSLEGVPENVTAAAGLNQWREAVDPANTDPASMRAAYARLDQAVHDALGSRSEYTIDEVARMEDSPPTPFRSNPSAAVDEVDGAFGTTLAGAVTTPEKYGFGARQREIEEMERGPTSDLDLGIDDDGTDAAETRAG